MDTKPFAVLLGEELNTVAFVMDYVEFHFNGPILRAIANPTLTQGKKSWSFPQPGSRDALCELIGSRVTRVELNEGSRIVLETDSGYELEIPLDEASQRAGESAHFLPNGASSMMVW
jgi:hypothetical protein